MSPIHRVIHQTQIRWKMVGHKKALDLRGEDRGPNVLNSSLEFKTPLREVKRETDRTGARVRLNTMIQTLSKSSTYFFGLKP